MPQTQEIVSTMCQLAKNASYKLGALSSEFKNNALKAIAQSIEKNRSFIKAENKLDLQLARDAQLSQPLIERLTLTDKRIDDMINSVVSIASQSDPIGKLITSRQLDNGLQLNKVRVPLGVVGIIFESRPNVVADVAALCIKSGNAVILRGGKEAQHSNRAIMSAIESALTQIEFVPFAVQMVPISDRAAVSFLCQQSNLVDVIIPRGGEGLIQSVMDCATVPVIKHYKGICHVYVDASADLKMALDICYNAKCQRPSVCNAAETILVHQDIADRFLPELHKLFDEANVEMRGDEHARTICPGMHAASPKDWSTEYLDRIVSIKLVPRFIDAINHINMYGSHHSDAIITEDKQHALQFCKEVDSAAVYVNASTRFTDGSAFGLGAEMGISTDKLHARGPMGVFELTTYKWVGMGSGQIRS